jgi:hypothetical protein
MMDGGWWYWEDNFCKYRYDRHNNHYRWCGDVSSSALSL